ncbi:hypothetical protein KY343_00920 [Candidatus Woesearchaeota archaeon]|nr:hypothetical protein [Candidatus Woesearchaeota archaeon]
MAKGDKVKVSIDTCANLPDDTDRVLEEHEFIGADKTEENEYRGARRYWDENDAVCRLTGYPCVLLSEIAMHEYFLRGTERERCPGHKKITRTYDAVDYDHEKGLPRTEHRGRVTE